MLLRFYLWVLSYCPWLYELAYSGNRQSEGQDNAMVRVTLLMVLSRRLISEIWLGFYRQDQPRCLWCRTCYTGRYHGYLHKKIQAGFAVGAVVLNDYTVKWWLCGERWCVTRIKEKICVHSLMGLMLRFYRRECRFGSNLPSIWSSRQGGASRKI